ncbi:MAG: molecular chaperone DnaJ [Phycisphaerae bacterium]
MSTRVAQKRDYYEVLGVARDVSPDELKRAYRQAAMKYHPDRNKEPGAEERFKEASEAYEVLSDPEKRQRYDRFGHSGLTGVGMHDFSHMQAEDIFSVFGDLFGDLLGGGRGRARADRGIDIQAVLEIDLNEVATGVEKVLRFERSDFCERCGGRGAEPGSSPATCRACGGYGQVERQTSMGFFVTRTVVDCPNCHGRGKTIDKPCRDCRGSGRAHKERVLTVKIPPGIQDGQMIRLRGEGEPSPGGSTRGELRCVIRVREHPLFERDGDTLICRFPISFTQAALGAQIEVPTLNGTTPLKIPAGTQYGATFSLSGKGLPNLRNGRVGDEIVQVLIEVPRKLSKPQQDLLRKFAATEDKAVMPETRGFFDRMKGYFTGEAENREPPRPTPDEAGE